MSAKVDPFIRKTLSLRTSLWQQIEDYQFKKRMKRDAEVMRRLLMVGLATESARDSATQSMSGAEARAG